MCGDNTHEAVLQLHSAAASAHGPHVPLLTFKSLPFSSSFVSRKDFRVSM